MNERATFAGANLPATLPDIDAIEAGFKRSLALYESAFTKIAEADEAIKLACAAIEAVTPGAHFHSDRDGREIDAFHKLLDERKGWLVDLPAGSFSEVGTHVNTVLVGFGLSRCYSI